MSSDHVEPTQDTAVPSHVVIHQGSRRLELRWPDGGSLSVSHGRLRSACKCAWCERLRRQPAQPHEDDADVAIEAAIPVGCIGLQLRFSDGHDKGIYPWPYLRSLAT